MAPALGLGFIPWVDTIFKPKGAVPLVIEHKEEIARDIAEKVTNPFSISEWLGIKSKVRELADELHQRALLTPDPNDDKIDYVQHLYDFVDKAPLTHFMPDWFKDIIVFLTSVCANATHGAIQWVFKIIFECLTSIVLYTPEFLFNSSWFSSSVAHFSLLSMSLVSIMTMIEGLKRIFKKDFTPFRHTLKRLPLAVFVSGITPYAFSKGVHWLNKLTRLICEMGGKEIASSQPVLDSSLSFFYEPINISIMLVFFILYLYQMIPMLFSHSRRWFLFIASAAMTPFAMCAYLFHSTEHYFEQWLNAIKRHGINQLGYAIWINLLGLLMFGTPNPSSLGEMFTKLLLLLGGMSVLSNPPSIIVEFVKQRSHMIRDIKNRIEDSVDKVQKGIKIADTSLITGAKVAGKLYRWIKG